MKDYATSTILTAPSPATSGTSLVVQSGHGARFPAAPFSVTVHPPSELPTLDNAEKLEVTAKTDDTFTILRAQGDTTAKSIEVGWRISNSLFLDDIPVVNSTTVDAAGAVMNSDTSTAGMSFVVDEDNMASDSATKLATQQSIKAYVDTAISNAKQALLPVGSIVVLGVSTNPNTLYGFGTWTAIAGRVLVGYDSGQTEFDTLDETGGAKTHTLSISEIPNRTGQMVAHSSRSAWWAPSGVYSTSAMQSHYVVPAGATGGANSTYNWNFNLGGGGGAHNNLQPYIVKYMWQRTA